MQSYKHSLHNTFKFYLHKSLHLPLYLRYKNIYNLIVLVLTNLGYIILLFYRKLNKFIRIVKNHIFIICRFAFYFTSFNR
nr:MAG TPA: hypothetical protein [Caudoviricetes sp.]